MDSAADAADDDHGRVLILQRPLDRAMRKLQAESAARHGVLVESLSGIETVRATGAEARMQTAWERSVAATARSGEDVHFWSSLSLTSANTAQQLNYLLMVIVGVFLILDGKLTVGALVAANMLAGRVLAPIAGIATVITARPRPSSRSNRSTASCRWSASDRRSGLTFRGRSRRADCLRERHFPYPNAPGNALEKVSFKIDGGERVGIIGRVGSGKTTVGRLLLGFYEPQEGRILVDGVDSRQYDPADLRTGIGFAMQDTDLFFGKLRDNIALGKPKPPTKRFWPRRACPVSKASSPGIRWATICRFPRAAAACRAARNRRSGLPAC